MPIPDLPVPHAAPLTRVSPTSASDLLACGLRAAFSRDPVLRVWRRPSTYSLLGTVAHAVIEAAFKRADWEDDPEAARAQISALWDEQVNRAAGTLIKAWAPSAPPRPELWPGYQLTRSRTIRRAVRLVSSRERATGPHQPGTGVEVELEDATSGLSGRVDRIERHGSATRVVDLKTGLHQGEPTEEQHRQLLLYAVLVRQETGEWPSEIAIEDASGGQISMPLEVAEAEATAKEVAEAVRAFNELNGTGHIVEAARPTAERCRWCAFRVVCAPYWHRLRSDWGHRSLLGEVLEVGNSDHGTFVRLRVESPVDLAGSVVHVSVLPAPLGSSDKWMAAVGVEGDPVLAEVRARWSTTVRIW